MKEHDRVRIKSGRLKGCKGDILEIVADEDMEAYRVALVEVTPEAHTRGYRVEDSVDMDRHELEPT
jgi:ribosomal protein L24